MSAHAQSTDLNTTAACGADGGGGGTKTTATRNRSDVHDKFEAKRDMRHDLIAEAVELVRLANHEDVQRLA